ncbi:hypothetical protein IscW_ISCW003210 [Ixodes scapularis]|uniref:Uncharacterized protein n=1 Tax=Ixodes scapularis TaxID=6945 RepID=B7PC46_IXOSC|nr:hypothetical protein IscW_ISCW003210 [Ixodes scapularis]|eukprot:XP_002409329.1 hypothetical protein IscW_ISCW003210 [Ixodes scapularis]
MQYCLSLSSLRDCLRNRNKDVVTMVSQHWHSVLCAATGDFHRMLLHRPMRE